MRRGEIDVLFEELELLGQTFMFPSKNISSAPSLLCFYYSSETEF